MGASHVQLDLSGVTLDAMMAVPTAVGFVGIGLSVIGECDIGESDPNPRLSGGADHDGDHVVLARAIAVDDIGDDDRDVIGGSTLEGEVDEPRHRAGGVA